MNDLCRVGDDGTFTAAIPRLAGFTITAAAPGWQPATVPLGLASSPCRVRLVLAKKSLMISGIIRTTDGEALAGIDVAGFVVIQGPPDEFPMDEYANRGHGFKRLVSLRRNVATVIFLLYARSDDAGEFRFPANVKGDLTLVSWPGGRYRVTRLAMGNLTADVTGLEMVVEEGDGATVQFRSSTIPMRKKRISLTDLSLVQQPGFSQELTEDGRLFASNLEYGHRYALRWRGKMGSYFFVWNGEETIDVDRLATRPPWFEKGK